MKEIFTILSLTIFAFCLVSFIISVFGRLGIKSRCKCRKNDGGLSSFGLFSSEIFTGLLFLVIAIILIKVDTGAAIMLEIAIALLALSFVWGVVIRISPYKRRRILSFTFIMPVAIFVSGALVLFAVYYYGVGEAGELDKFNGNLWPSIEAAVHHSARLFALDGAYVETVDRIRDFGAYTASYVSFIGIIYVAAGFTTFTTVLTIVKNLSARFKYAMHACIPLVNSWRAVHVFSSLSDESLALAASLTTLPEGATLSERVRFHITRPVIVFAATEDVGENASLDLIEEAKERGAILFSKDIASIRFRKRNHYYYVMGTNEGEKLRAAKELITYYGPYENKLYVFSETAQSEMFLNALDPGNMKLVRVNAIQSLIYRALYDNGERLFKGASPSDDGSGERVISAVIVGLGMYGKEMLKALSWFCQMDGYRLKINAFDSDELAETKLRRACPELMNMSDNTVKGEAHYSIRVETCDIDSEKFYEELSKITDVSYVFVCLGDDETNLKVSKGIRELYERLKRTTGILNGRAFGAPDIETVIYDSSIKEMLSMDYVRSGFGRCDRAVDGGRNFKNQPYRIHVIGDLKSFYSVDTLTGDGENDRLFKAGEEVHLRWTWASYVNARHKDAVLAHVKDRSREGMPEVVWLVKPRLDFALPSLRSVLINDIKNENLDALGIDTGHYRELLKGLREVVGKREGELDEADFERITELRGRFHFVEDVLTKNYELVFIKDDAKYESIKTPAETVVITPYGEKTARAPEQMDKKALRAAKRDAKKRRIEAEREYFAECEKGRKTFWRYTYYYRSSLAKAIHEDLRRKLASDPDKSLLRSEELRRAFLAKTEERSEAELNIICALEHLRWNAFTRAEGYSFADSKYDLAKQHNNLVPTEKLSPSDLRKDA